MPEPNGSLLVTILLCVALVGLNYFAFHLKFGTWAYFEWWPVGFILCTLIFARIVRGHSSP